MATDNEKDPSKKDTGKKELKNPELLDGSKQTIQQLVDRGPQRIPGPGQDYRDKHKNPSRGNLQKPGVFNEAMKAQEEKKDPEKEPTKDTTKDPKKEPEKPVDHDKDKD